MFSSIDNNLYHLLDKLTFIDNDIIHNSYFETFFGNNLSSSLLLIANALLIGLVAYYCAKLLFSSFASIDLESPYQFIFKIILFTIFINSSYFFCEQFININSLLSSSINAIGKNLFHTDISFNSLISNLNSIITIEQSGLNVFSVNGLIKSFISISLLNLVFSYALRYIMVKVFILLIPFAFLSLIHSSTSWFFKTWLRSFSSLLLLQSLISLILLIIFSISYSPQDLFSQFMYIGGIYALTKANSYIQNLLGGISTEVSTHFKTLSSFIKH